MIVFKNNIEEEENSKNSSDFPFQFTINDITVSLTKNYPHLYEKIQNLIKDQKETETIKISIPKSIDEKNQKEEEDYDDDIDRIRYHSDYHYENQNCKTVFNSNFDNRNIQIENNHRYSNRYHEYSDYDYEYSTYEYEYSNRYSPKCSKNADYYNNKMISKSSLPFIKTKSEKNNDGLLNFAIKQFQLVLNGHDIIIADFVVDDMLQIAEKFQMQELIDEILPLKEQLDDLQNYNKFSELEILIYLEDLLTTIDDKNFNEKSSVIYSIYAYLERCLFKEILLCFTSLFTDKYQLYLQIAQMININDEFERSYLYMKSNTSDLYEQRRFYESRESYTYGFLRRKQIHVNDDLLSFIKKDDVDSLQKLSCNPKFDFTEEFTFLTIDNTYKNTPIKNLCNAIECAAFYGSIKCFKFLILNEKFESSDLVPFAIAGGNTEIIHLCEQKKCSFQNTLKIAIDYHRNDIAEWIVVNDKDEIREDIYKYCIKANNFDMLQFFLNKKSESTLNDDKFWAKYILYSSQNYNVPVITSSSLINYLMKYKCMKYQDRFGLIYCPNEKVELINMNVSDDRNDLFSYPLIFAALNGDLDMCNLLIKNKSFTKITYYDEDEFEEYYSIRRGRTKSDRLKLNIENNLNGKNVIIFLLF